MERAVLVILVSTMASESSFSTEGRVLDLYHCFLTPQMVEALVYAFVCKEVKALLGRKRSNDDA
ncbi:hypothetical protein JHK85_040961 [Glycine max]|nr:hypothetical protein JHK85_040961 [Glycine max]